MTFLHAALLGGLVLTAVPVLMHLLLKQKPKQVDFPALRLVRSRTKRSTQRLRLRHLLLLLLRIGLIGGIVFAAARPLLPAANWSFTPANWATLLACGAGAYGLHAWLKSRPLQTASQVEREQRTRRNGWLTAIAAALLLLLALGVPYGTRVSASMKEAPSAETMNLPVAGVFVFDVSPSMQYTQQGRTLLDAARRLVAEHVGRLPDGSRVAITDNASTGPVPFQVSLTNVPAQLERLTFRSDARPLNSAIAAAFDAHASDRERVMVGGENRDRFVRRVYVLTDLAKSAWQFPDGSGLMETLKSEDTPGLFVCDVGVLENVVNRGLVGFQVSPERVARGGTVTAAATFREVGPAGETPVELFLNEQGQDVRLGQATAVRSSQELTFRPSLTTEQPFAQGRIALGSTDPLAIDDARFFTVAVDALPKLLLVAPDPDDVFEFRVALEGDPEAGVSSRYAMTLIRPGELDESRLATQDVVVMVNVPSLEDSQWGELEAFVREGGGLAVVLGSYGVESFAYNRAAARAVLPGSVDVYESRPASEPARMLFEADSHPLVERLANIAESDEVLGGADILRFWRVDPDEGARVLARYSADALPAMLERRLGEGIVTMLTTAVDIKPRRESWNNLPLVDGAEWVYVVFLDQWMRHLARAGQGGLNFIAGPPPRIVLPDEAAGKPLRLNMPDFRTLPLASSEPGNPVVLNDATAVGHYLIADENGTPLQAFSVNYADSESDLTRATEGDLVSVFGEGNVTVARDLTQLSEDIDLARFGQEAFPAVLLLAVAFFLGETLLSSRFYGDDGPLRDGDGAAARIRKQAAAA